MAALFHRRGWPLLLAVPSLILIIVMLLALTGASAETATFGAPTGYDTASSFNVPSYATMGDFNGDGAFGTANTYTPGERAIGLVDLNNDGFVDLIGGGANGEVAVL